MTGLVILLSLLAAALCVLYVVTGIELDRVTDQRDRLAADNARQANLIAALQSTPDAQVLPFGPVQTGMVRLPRQRNGEGA